MPVMPSPYAAVPGGLQQAAPPLGAGPRHPGSDVFREIVLMMMADPRWVERFVGIGMVKAAEMLQKAGSLSATKPHRQNQELAQRGMPVGSPGQTGFADPATLARTLTRPMAPEGLGPGALLGSPV